MFAMTVSDPDVIAIAAVLVSLAVGVPAWANFFRSRKNREILGRPNGEGSLAGMIEALHSRMRGLETSIASLHVQQLAHEDHDDRRFVEVDRQLGRVARSVKSCPGWHPGDDDDD